MTSRAFTISNISIFLVTLGLIGCNSVPTKNSTSFTAAVAIDSLILSVGEFNGVVLVTIDGEIRYSKGFGFSNIDEDIKLQTDDQFVIGSISKQITAVLVLREYEKGTIKLENVLSEYLPELNQTWSDSITVHHLLTHTHGISALDQPLMFEPGSQFQYSQLGFELLSKIIEKVTGNEFAVVADKLFDQYALINTSHPDSGYDNLVSGYIEQLDGAIVFDLTSLMNYVAAGSFISTAKDLALWNTLLHERTLVSDSTFELMARRYATRKHPIFEEVEYGYGLLFKKR